MDEEAGFIAALAADPFDLIALGAYRDWLEDNDRPRAIADGWAALYATGRVPRNRWRKLNDRFGVDIWQYVKETNCWARGGAFAEGPLCEFALADDWIALMTPDARVPASNVEAGWREYLSSRDAEAEAVRAFSLLPEARQAELLRGPVAPAAT